MLKVWVLIIIFDVGGVTSTKVEHMDRTSCITALRSVISKGANESSICINSDTGETIKISDLK